MPLNTSLRSYGYMQGDSHFFKLDIPAAGLVTLDVAVPGFAEVEAKLGLLSRGCGPSPSPGEPAVIEQTPTRLALIADAPGTYVFAVAAQDPRSVLGQYKLTAGFVAAKMLGRQAFEWGFAKDGEEDDDELEIDPDLKHGLRPGVQTFWDTPHPASRQLCRRLELDDHGDTFACATPLHPGSKVTATILGSWGDDQDLFVFTLTEARTVQLATSGPTDTFGVLHDADRHRLATDDDGGEGDNFRIVKTLSPGLYFVRVEGAHAAEGAYTLLAEARSW